MPSAGRGHRLRGMSPAFRVFRRVALCAMLGATWAVGGCSLLVSVDGLAGGGDGDRDGGDGGDGATLAETGGVDGSSDRQGASEVGASLSCVGTILCDDFERSDVVGKGWVLSGVVSATLAIDSTTSTSPTRSLHLHLPAGTGTTAGASLFFDGAGQSGTVLHLTFAMKIDAAPDREIQVVLLQLHQAAKDEQVLVSLLPGRISLAEQTSGSAASYAEHMLPAGPVASVWQRWRIDLDASTATAVATVAIDGVERLHQPLSNGFETGTPQVAVGANFTRAGAAHDVWFDDVALRVDP